MIRNKLVEILSKYKQWLKGIIRLEERKDSKEDDLSDTNLIYPDFSIFEANLSKADLRDVCSRANLSNANLTDRN